MKFSESISIILPAYNDEEIIGKTIETSLEKLQKLFNDFELILIDDASTDGTKKKIQDYAHKYPNCISTIYHPKNLGVGSGIRNGFSKATKTYVMTNLSDLPFDFDDLTRIFPKVLEEDADGCVVVRHNRSAHSPFRKLTSYTNYLIIRSLFNVPIRDFQFVQLYKRSVLKNIKINAKDVFVPPEIIIRLYDKGFKLIQEEADFNKREAGSAKYGQVKFFISTFKDQIKFFFEMRVKRDNGS